MTHRTNHKKAKPIRSIVIPTDLDRGKLVPVTWYPDAEIYECGGDFYRRNYDFRSIDEYAGSCETCDMCEENTGLKNTLCKTAPRNKTDLGIKDCSKQPLFNMKLMDEIHAELLKVSTIPEKDNKDENNNKDP